MTKKRFLKNKIIVFFTVFFALFFTFSAAACGNPGKNYVNDDFSVANITIFGNNVEVKSDSTLSKGVLVSISGNLVSTDEFNVYLYAAKKDYAKYFGEEIFDYKYTENATIGELLKERILEYMISVKLICEAADAENMYLTSEELAEVDVHVAEFIQKNVSGSNNDLYIDLNKEAIRKVYSDGFLAKKYYDKFNGNEEEFFSSVRVKAAEKEIFLNEYEWEAI